MGRIGEPWSDNADVKLVRTGEIKSPKESFGAFPYYLYEAYPPERKFSPEAPYVLVWLHGQSDMNVMTEKDVAFMARKFNRRIVCMAPKNPKPANGTSFFWALGFTKAQNKNDHGFVNGELNHEVCALLCAAINDVVDEARADRVILGGYSMGGFGAFQLGGYRPILFDVIFSIAGHGMGTLCPANEGYKVPQPDGEVAFDRFSSAHAPNLAKIPFVLAIHAEKDAVSYYRDVEVLINQVRSLGGESMLVTVPEEHRNSDTSSKSKTGHGYHSFAMLKETSDAALYRPIIAALASERCIYKKEIAALDAEMTSQQKQAQAAQMALQAKLFEENRVKRLDEKQRNEEENKRQEEEAKRKAERDESEERKKAKKQKKDEKKDKEEKKKQEAAEKDEERRKQMRERKNKGVPVAAVAAAVAPGAVAGKSPGPGPKPQGVAQPVQSADEIKRQQMRERRLKSLEQKAQEDAAKIL